MVGVSIALVVLTLIVARRAGERTAWLLLAASMAVVTITVIANHPYL